MEQNDDKELINQVIKSSYDAQEKFVDKYIDLIYSTIQHFNIIYKFPFQQESLITPSDVAVDIILKIWDDNYRRLRTWDYKKGRFSTYLWSIVWNYCHDLLKKISREGELFVSLDEIIYEEDDNLIVEDDRSQPPLLIHRIRRGLLNNSVSPGLDQFPLSLIEEQLPVASHLRVFFQPEALRLIRKQFRGVRTVG